MNRAVDLDLLVRNGWAIALRGLLASAFGACLIVVHSVPLPALVLAYGMYSVVDGVFAFFVALQRRRPNEAPHWAYLMVGAPGVGLGLVMLLWGGMTVSGLVYLMAAAACVSGLAQVAAALRLRRQVRGEWLMALAGLLALAFGIASVALSIESATLSHWIGGYRILDGAILAALALRLRGWEKQALGRVVAGAGERPVLELSLEPALEGAGEPTLEVDIVPEPVADPKATQPVASPFAE